MARTRRAPRRAHKRHHGAHEGQHGAHAGPHGAHAGRHHAGPNIFTLLWYDKGVRSALGHETTRVSGHLLTGLCALLGLFTE